MLCVRSFLLLPGVAIAVRWDIGLPFVAILHVVGLVGRGGPMTPCIARTGISIHTGTTAPLGSSHYG